MVFNGKKTQKKKSLARGKKKSASVKKLNSSKHKRASVQGRKRGQLFFTVFLWSAFICIITFSWMWYDLPDLNKLKIATRRPHIEFLDAGGNSLISYGDKHLEPLSFNKIPRFVPLAVMAIEDHRFYEHGGIDFLGLIRAFVINLSLGRVQQGGSTLTQQLAKTLFLSPKRTVKRKLQELIVSVWLEKNFSKEQMLTIYLNRVYMGPGLYGFSAASRHYFGKDLRKLSLWQAAGLAGMLKGPHKYSPFYSKENFKRRAALVLRRMGELHYIKKEKYRFAMKELLDYRVSKKRASGSSSRYFTDWVYKQIYRHIGNINQDLIILTTYSPFAQKSLDAAVELFNGDSSLSKSQVAMVAMGQRGNVVGMVGGRDYFFSSFNRAFQARRQTGSIFKLFVYMAALMKGMRPEDKIKDTQLRLGNWRPRNYAWRSRGYLTMADAFAYSVNTVTVRIAKKIGATAFLKLAKEMGALKSIPQKPDLTMSLGTLESSLLATTSSFSVIANDCRYVEPYGIKKISTVSGKILYQRGQYSRGGYVAPQKICNNMKGMLAKVTNYGTGKKVRRGGHFSYGKTGTTQNHRDAWFVGFEHPYVLGIWIGNDNNSSLPGKMTGGQMPAQLWKTVMSHLKR